MIGASLAGFFLIYDYNLQFIFILFGFCFFNFFIVSSKGELSYCNFKKIFKNVILDFKISPEWLSEKCLRKNFIESKYFSSFLLFIIGIFILILSNYLVEKYWNFYLYGIFIVYCIIAFIIHLDNKKWIKLNEY